MNIAEAKQQIKNTVEAYLSTDEVGTYLITGPAQRPIFLLGAPGIGKTAIVSQVASELEIGLVSYSMTHHTRQSALGLPVIVHKSYKGEEFDVSEYTMSEIIAAIYDYMDATGHDRGILFLDEVNCVSETLYPSMLQFLQFKTFGRHSVPDGWIVVCAGNPTEYNKSVHDFDVVTMDRLRKVAVEPDLEAWLAYAAATGVHPSITTYLQIKRDKFYLVEDSPLGKRFVTARGWDDLSKIMKLYESQGTAVDRVLVEQYLQDDRVVDDFSQYYLLFTKYRSDYQIPRILEGCEDDEIRQRAASARLDERLAITNLLVERLAGVCADVVESAEQVTALRDTLRGAKDELLAGESVDGVLGREAEKLMDAADTRVARGLSSDADVKGLRLAARKLKEYARICEASRTPAGAESFAQIERAYTELSEALRAAKDQASASIDNAFAFMETVFGDGREMAVFVTELSGNRGTSCFISQFGSDSYYAHSSVVQPDKQRRALMSEIEALGLQ